MKTTLLLLTIYMVKGQLFPGDGHELVPAGTMMNMPVITNLDVECETSGMTVTIEFSQPFNGIIFSKGHYSNPACRYVSGASGETTYFFHISSNDCGSIMDQLKIDGQDSKTEITNTIIIQNDPTVQEIWDSARTLKCDWVDNTVKTVRFDPFTVGMLDTQEVRFGGKPPIDCWMDLQLGRWPNIRNIDSVVKIGEELSLLIYVRDNQGMFDVNVRDCYAFGGPDYDNTLTPRVQLTNQKGCVLKEKLISSFHSIREKQNSDTVIVTYAVVNAFKFPDVKDIYMTCNVEICKGICESLCSPKTTTPNYPSGSTLFGAIITTTPSTTTTTTTTQKPTTQFTCLPGLIDPRCPPVCFPGSLDPRCPIITTTTTAKPRTGSILFPATITTTSTTETTTTQPPKTTAKAIPKQLIEPKPQPEPSGAEWEGESRHHAFHSFHFDKGDGRRRHLFGARLPRDLTATESKDDNLSVTLPLQLQKRFQVESLIDLLPDLGLQDQNNFALLTNIESTICISQVSFVFIVACLLFSVFMCVAISWICFRQKKSA